MRSIGKILVRTNHRLLEAFERMQATGVEPIANIVNVRQDKFYEIGECVWYRLGHVDIVRHGHLFTFVAPNMYLVFSAAERLGFSKDEFDLLPERPAAEEVEASL